MGNRVHRDPCRVDRVLEQITERFELKHPSRLIGARVVASGFDVALYVLISDTLVRYKARRRQPANFDRTTSLIKVVETLAADGLDVPRHDPSGVADPALAEIDLPPITGWRVLPMWPDQMICMAIAETCRLIAVATGDIEAPANGVDYGSHRGAIGATNDLLHTVLQTPVAYLATGDGQLLVPARLVFTALLLGLPTRDWRIRDLGRWEALSVDNVDLLVATTEPTWVVTAATDRLLVVRNAGLTSSAEKLNGRCR